MGQPHCPRTGEPTPEPHAPARSSRPSCRCRRHRGRAARAGVQDLRRGARRRLHRGAEEGLPPPDRRRQAPSTCPRRSTLESADVEHMDAVVDRVIVGRQAREGDQGGNRGHAAGRRRPACRSTSSRARRRPRPTGSTRACAARRITSSTATSARTTSCSTTPRAPAARAAASASTSSRTPSCWCPTRSAASSAAASCARRSSYNPDTWDGRMMYSLVAGAWLSASTRRGRSCPDAVQSAILYGIEPRKIAVQTPPDAKVRRDDQEGKEVGFGGIARRIERYYRRYRQRGEANSTDGGVARQGDGRAHLPGLQRRAPARDAAAASRSNGRSIHDVGQLNFDELQAFLATVKPSGRGADAGRQVLNEIRGRLDAAPRHRPRLPQLEPAVGDALRRRVAAHPAVDADRLGPDGDAVRARRAEHRPAPRRTT